MTHHPTLRNPLAPNPVALVLCTLALAVTTSAQAVKEDWRLQSFGTRFQFDMQNNICLDGSGPLRDIYAHKFDPRGNLIWQQSSGNPLVNEHPNWMAVDSGGNVIVTGHRTSGTTVQGGILTVKFSANGAVLWSVVAPASREGYRVEVDAADNIYIAGDVFDNSARRRDFLTIKYDPAGNEVWRNQRDFGLNNDGPSSLAVSPAGRVAVSGSTNVTMAVVVYDVNGTEVFGDFHSPTRGGHDVVMAKDGSVYVCGLGSQSGGTVVRWDAQGNKLWASAYRTSHSAFGNFQRLALDSVGNLVALGWGTGQYGYQDWLIAKFDPAGNLLWGTSHDGFDYNDEFGTALTIGPDDAIYVAGLSGAPGCQPSSPRGMGTAIIRYNTTGTLDWIYEAPCFGSRASWLALDSLGELVVNGGTGRLMRLVRKRWRTLGGSMAGANGAPTLDVQGYLAPRATVTVSLTNALPQSAGVHILGSYRVNLPFAGGTLVPHWTATAPMVTDAQGQSSFAVVMPPFIPVSTELTLQSWIIDPGGPRGLAASNAVIKGLQ